MDDELPTTSAQDAAATDDEQRPLRIGCALLPKKVARYLTPAMKETAVENGIELCLIDYARPLTEQGPFDAIVHKLRPNKDWERNLLDYSRQNPGMTVIDSVDGIRTLQNRSTMLFPLQGDGIVMQPVNGARSSGDHCQVRVQSPAQVEIMEGETIAQAHQKLSDAGLSAPLLVKPMWTDGREGSHGLAVLHDLQSLEKLMEGHVSSDLKPPLVVQQYVEHGGVLFKVYVLGQHTVVSKRPSLGENYLGKGTRRKGVLQLPRISCKSVYAAQQLGGPNGCSPLPGSPQVASEIASAASSDLDDTDGCPPEWVTRTLSRVLRERPGLQLFNFDLICPEAQSTPGECLYYVIDINYFPGVDKLPNFERAFVDFLRAACTDDTQPGSQRSSRDLTPVQGNGYGQAASPEPGEGIVVSIGAPATAPSPAGMPLQQQQQHTGAHGHGHKGTEQQRPAACMPSDCKHADTVLAA